MLKAVPSDFYAAPVSIFKDHKITSYLFIVSYYHAGAAHPMTMYFALTLTTRRAKEFSITTIFRLIKNQTRLILLT